MPAELPLRCAFVSGADVRNVSPSPSMNPATPRQVITVRPGPAGWGPVSGSSSFVTRLPLWAAACGGLGRAEVLPGTVDASTGNSRPRPRGWSTRLASSASRFETRLQRCEPSLGRVPAGRGPAAVPPRRREWPSAARRGGPRESAARPRWPPARVDGRTTACRPVATSPVGRRPGRP